MKEFESVLTSDMQSAQSLESEHLFTSAFDFSRQLPENLAALDELSKNFYWSWNPEGTGLFREVDPTLWDKCEQNPRLVLKKVSELRLWQKSIDPAYVERLEQFKAVNDSYLAQMPGAFGKVTPANPAAYFCAEYGVHNSLPTYSGGWEFSPATT